ncbi:MAG: hypothetical protein DRR42_18880 [Gammaproteobacteria bacterium]|nr:MAG: hypothetical protein DRR42_18880 [Gammaproteobacteria bacterium]
MDEPLKIPKEPSHGGRFHNGLYFTSAARRGLFHLLKHSALLGSRQHILLPAYIGITEREGSGVLDPIIEAGWTHDFYPLSPDLSPADGLDKLLVAEPGAALLVIHYFGWPVHEIGKLADRCRAEGRMLFEDCAHVLHDYGSAIGSYGDGAIWSIHKTLPVNSGGIVKWSGYAQWVEVTADTMSQDVIVTMCHTDLSAVADQRRRNFDQLFARLEGSGCQLRWQPGDHTALNMPLLVPQGVDRFELYKRLIQREVGVVALYYRLVDEIDIEQHPVSKEIMRRILNLPIHQDLGHREIEFIAETFLTELNAA